MNEDFSQTPKADRASLAGKFHARFQRYRNLLLRRWWVLVLAAVAAGGLQYWRLSHALPVFQSVGQMIVNIKLNISQNALYSEELGNFLGTQAALMQGKTVLNHARERVATENPGLAPQSVAVDVSVLPKTTIFVLRGTATEPVYAQKFLQACMEEYISLKKEMAAHTSDTTIAGLTEQIQKIEPEITKIDDQIAEYLRTNDAVLLAESGVMNTFLGTLYQRGADAQSQFDMLNSMTLDQSLLLQQEQQPAMLPSAQSPGTEAIGNGSVLVNTGLGQQVGVSAGVNTIGTEYLSTKQQILLLKADKQRLEEYLKPLHPNVVALDETLERFNRLLAIYRDQSNEQLEAQKDALAVQIKNLKKQIEQTGQQNLELSRKSAQYDRLKARSQRIQALYDQLLNALQSLDVNKEISPESVTIYQPASEAQPTQPSLPHDLAIAAFIGIGLGLGLLLLIDRMDDRLNSVTELQEFFDEPVLGQIPREEKRSIREEMFLLRPEDDRLPFVESFRNLRSSLLYLDSKVPYPRRLLITSSVPNDGKSIVAANLAVSLALSGSRVLLVDADLRKGHMHERFGLKAEKGLGQMLTQHLNWRTLVLDTQVDKLKLLPRGAAEMNATEFFFTTDMETFVNQASAEYDFVIVDTPPVMVADEAASLAPRMDGVLFVVRAEATSSRIARAAINLLVQRKARVLGLVFNAVRPGANDYHDYARYKDYYNE